MQVGFDLGAESCPGLSLADPILSLWAGIPLGWKYSWEKNETQVLGEVKDSLDLHGDVPQLEKHGQAFSRCLCS